MTKKRTILVVWLSSVAVGVIVVERWRRVGGRRVAVTANVGEPDDTDGESTLSQESSTKRKVSTSIVTGARTDYDRARHLLQRVLPGQSTSAPSAIDTAVSETATTSVGSSGDSVGSPAQ